MKVLFFAMLLSIMQAAPPVPRQTADNGDSKSQKVEKNGGSEKAPTPNLESVQKTPSAIPTTANSQNNAKKNNQESVRISELPSVSVTSGWRDNLALLFTFLLLVVAGLGVCAALRTLKAIEHQTKLQARNLQFLVEKERPRISIEVQNLVRPDEESLVPLPPNVRIIIQCVCPTPAFIVEAQADTFFLERLRHIGPRDSLWLRPMIYKTRIIKRDVTERCNWEEWEKVTKKEATLCCRVRILYRGIHLPETAPSYETYYERRWVHEGEPWMYGYWTETETKDKNS